MKEMLCEVDGEVDAVTVQEYFNQYRIPEEVYKKVNPLFKIVHFHTGDTIIRLNEVTQHMWLICKGIVRGYYIDEDGNDITKCFSKEGDWCGYYNFIQKGAAPFYVEALEECCMAQIEVKLLEKALETDMTLQRLYTELSQNAFLQAEEKGISFQKMKAKERYLQFVEKSPEIVQRVKQEYIASYLGITPSSLSRIKREL